MENIERVLLEKIAASDLQELTSPYIPKTFALWRDELYSSFSGNLIDFIKLVDYVYLPKFLKCVCNAYTIAILADPNLKDLPKDDKGVGEIVRTLTQWSVEVELAVDMIERSKLYHLYEIPHGYDNLFTELKTEWRTPESSSSKFYKIFLKYLSFGAQQAKDLITDSVKGYVMDNIVQNKGSILASVVYSYFCSTMPWPVIALLGTQCAWIFSTVMLTKIGEKLVNKLDKTQTDYKTNELSRELDCMICELMKRNEESRELIEKAVNKNEQDLRNLSEHFNMVLSHKKTDYILQKSYDEDNFIAEHAQVREENGWIIVDQPRIEMEQVDDWMIIE
ncbi:hypothetical protein SteCoe_16779 [Stentor coeruleus]|uniref:Uncharacterized protein n=1 Tax=Stentor coeruleus TaxID=5963 RepID=A0A1R2C0F0_9CILI|nr:hypothetical protein SteCoe_16779 [Stentor coeruleus]